MNITTASTKADIIDASCEVIDTQAEQINDLKERQLILWTIVGILTALLAFGASPLRGTSVPFFITIQSNDLLPLRMPR